ncbi:MAG: DUF86 domain-containing protein [Clostridia bacterium]|nr:DUF86 domain-containing protein [Clostridia bacterium]
MLEKIISEIDIGVEIVNGYSYQEFIEREDVKRAVSMTLITIGELVKSLDDETRTSYPKVLWKEIAGMRDIAAHKYLSIDFKRVYDTAKDNLPELKVQLVEILSE